MAGCFRGARRGATDTLPPPIAIRIPLAPRPATGASAPDGSASEAALGRRRRPSCRVAQHGRELVRPRPARHRRQRLDQPEVLVRPDVRRGVEQRNEGQGFRSRREMIQIAPGGQHVLRDPVRRRAAPGAQHLDKGTRRVCALLRQRRLCDRGDGHVLQSDDPGGDVDDQRVAPGAGRRSGDADPHPPVAAAAARAAPPPRASIGERRSSPPPAGGFAAAHARRQWRTRRKLANRGMPLRVVP